MIRVTVELVPLGIEEKKYTLDVLTIANDGEGTYTRGNYNCKRRDSGQRGRVENHPRLSESVWELVCKAIAATRKSTKEL